MSNQASTTDQNRNELLKLFCKYDLLTVGDIANLLGWSHENTRVMVTEARMRKLIEPNPQKQSAPTNSRVHMPTGREVRRTKFKYQLTAKGSDWLTLNRLDGAPA